MSKRLFRKGDEVTLVSGPFLKQLKNWKNKKAIVTRNENTPDCYISITSDNNYHNYYPREDLKLIKANKTTEINKNFIKKHNRKKDFITTYLIQNFTIITKNDMKQ
jgi:hypothetical protein